MPAIDLYHILESLLAESARSIGSKGTQQQMSLMLHCCSRGFWETRSFSQRRFCYAFNFLSCLSHLDNRSFKFDQGNPKHTNHVSNEVSEYIS